MRTRLTLPARLCYQAIGLCLPRPCKRFRERKNFAQAETIKKGEVIVTRFIRVARAHSRTLLLCAAVVIAGSLAGGMLVSASPAWAASSDCASGNFCLWQDGLYSGTMWTFNQADNGYNKWNYVGASADNQASSAFNNRQHSADIANEDYCYGSGCTPVPYDTDCMIPGGGRGHLSDYSWPQDLTTENDSISYYDLLYSATTC